jgi:excinuclease ABC subunit A
MDAVSKHPRSLTGKYLSGERKIEIPATRRAGGGNALRILGATHNNLKNVDVEIPLGKFVCVTGVSGSGKSSIVSDILVEALRRDLNGGEGDPGAHRAIEGLEHLDKLIAIDQSPIGRTPRSNPGTYIKVFDDIRDLFCRCPRPNAAALSPGGSASMSREAAARRARGMAAIAWRWIFWPTCGSRARSARGNASAARRCR